MKEATKHEASLIRDGVMDDDTCLVVSAADYDALRQQLADVSNERDGLRAASVEMLRIAGIANQGSNAYNRAIENLHNAVQSTEQKAQS